MDDDDDYTLDDIEKELENDFDGTGQTPASSRKLKSSPRDVRKLKGDDLKQAIANKYNLKLKKKKKDDDDMPANLGEPSIGSTSASPGPRVEKEDDDLKKTELQRGFKYFLYHHHTLLSVLCVKHQSDLPRYARAYLFLFDLETNLMFALTLRESGLDFGERLFLTVFLCLIISFLMSSIFKNVGFNQMMSGRHCCGKFITLGLLMFVPSAILLSVIAVYTMRQPDGGQMALILFTCSCVITWIMEVLIWYFVYDCCKAYCSCFLCCCPNLLDDAEVAQADIDYKKKKEEEHARDIA